MGNRNTKQQQQQQQPANQPTIETTNMINEQPTHQQQNATNHQTTTVNLWNSLPTVIQSEILSFSDFTTLSKCSSVAHQFKVLTQNCSAWKYLLHESFNEFCQVTEPSQTRLQSSFYKQQYYFCAAYSRLLSPRPFHSQLSVQECNLVLDSFHSLISATPNRDSIQSYSYRSNFCPSCNSILQQQYDCLPKNNQERERILLQRQEKQNIQHNKGEGKLNNNYPTMQFSGFTIIESIQQVTFHCQQCQCQIVWEIPDVQCKICSLGK